MDRATLKSLVLDDLDRQDLSSSPQPDFWCRRAELRFDKDLRTRSQIRRQALKITKSIIQIPNDFIRADNLSIHAVDTTGTLIEKDGTLDYVPAQQMSDYQSRPGNYTFTRPSKYTMVGNDLMIWPPPGGLPGHAIWKLTFSYYAKIPPLKKDSDTNWLLEAHTDLYHDAMMLFGYGFLKEPAAAADKEASLMAGIAVLNAIGEDAASAASRLTARSKSPVGIRRYRRR